MAPRFTVTATLYFSTTDSVDISQYVMYDKGVSFAQGLRNFQDRTGRMTLTFTLNNTDGRFSPRNVNGAYYGRIKQNNKITITWYDPSAAAAMADPIVLTARIPEWTPNFDPGQRAEVVIEASGALTRFNAPENGALFSPLYQVNTANARMNTNGPVMYLPLEDGSTALHAARPVLGDTGGSANITNGTWEFGSDNDLPGALTAPRMTASSVLFAPVAYNFSQHWQVDFFARIPTAPASDTVLMRIWTNSSAIGIWDVIVGSTGYLLKGYQNGSPPTLVVTSSTVAYDPAMPLDQWRHVRLSCKDEGANLRWLITTTNLGPIGGLLTFATQGTTSGACGDVGAVAIPNQATLDGLGVAQIAVFDDYDLSLVDGAGSGYDGEDGFDRFERLCDEVGVSSLTQRTEDFFGGNSTHAVKMGPQRSSDFMTNVLEIQNATEGVVYDSSDQLKLVSPYYPFQRYDAFGGTTFANAMDGSQLFRLRLTDDTQNLVNQFTASRINGASVTAKLESGPLSVQDPPDGVFIYPGSEQYNLYTDDQVADHAHYRVHAGTVDKPRFSEIAIDMASHPEWSGFLDPSWVGDPIPEPVVLDNPPEDAGPSSIAQVVLGWTFDFTQADAVVRFNTVPLDIYRQYFLDSTVGRLDCGASTLNEVLDTTETGIDVAVNDECLWGHNTGDYVVTVGGEEVTVTAAGAASTSITFVAAGTASSGDAIQTTPTMPAGVATQDLLLVLGSSRDTNTDPELFLSGVSSAEYEEWINGINFKLWAKVHSGSETAPAVNFAAGAGDTCISQMAAFRGKFGDLGSQLMGTALRSNDSQQNVPLPSINTRQTNVLAIYVAWKADDLTSATMPTGFTQIGIPSSTAGNDACLVWGYQVVSTATKLPPGTFTITGGAAAISRSGAAAVRATQQTLTVTRSTNSAVLAHAIGEEVHVRDKIILAL